MFLVFAARHNNPALKDWIVEFDFLGQLHHALKHKTNVVVKTGDNEEYPLSVTEIRYIDPDNSDDDKSGLKNLRIHPGL